MVRDPVQDWERLSKEALILSPEYIKLPHVSLEEITLKDYELLDGSSDVMPFHDELYSDLINDGFSEGCAYKMAFVVIEAVQNAQEHAYKWQKYDSKGALNTINVGTIFTPKYDLIGISSKGNIDLDKIRKLIAENEAIQFGSRGRGFYAMIKVCDVVYPNQDDENLEIMLMIMKNQFYDKC